MNAATARERLTTLWPWLRWPLILSACVLCAAFVWQRDLGFSASANDWLAGLAGSGGPTHAVFGRLLRRMALFWGATDLGGWVIHTQLVAGILQLVLLVTVGRLAGLGDCAIALPLAMVALPSGRSGLATVGVENVLGTLTLITCVGVGGMQRFPRFSAVLLGGTWFATALAHPMGLAALPILLVVAGLFPRPNQPKPATEAWAARPIWLPWTAAVVLCVALLVITLPDERIKTFWDETIRLLRSTAAAPATGPMGDVWLVGPVISTLLSLPMAAAALGVSGAVSAWSRKPSEPIAMIAAFAAGWLVAVAAVGRPTAAPFDVTVVVTPLLTVLAVDAMLTLARALGRGRTGRVTAAALVAGALLATGLEEIGRAPDDPRGALARATGWLDDPSADRPARLGGADMAVLTQHEQTTSILPAHRGGDPLARRLVKLKLLPQNRVFVRPFAARAVLLHMPPTDPISEAWARGHQPLDCDAGQRACLFAIKPVNK